MQECQAKLDEIALLVMMLHPNDEQSLDLVEGLLNELRDVCANQPTASRLVSAIVYLLELRKQGNNDHLIQAIGEFVDQAQKFVLDPEHVTFANEQKKISSWGDDLSNQADPELIVEFIEKHTLALDDFDARLMEAANLDQYSEDKVKELNRYLASYLHNIKGDAGAVGFMGIEKCTHKLESVLLDSDGIKLLDLLLGYKEWVLDVCKAYSAGVVPVKSSVEFIAEIQNQALGERQNVSNEQQIQKSLVADDNAKCVDKIEEKRGFQPVEYAIGGDPELLMEFIVEAQDHLNTVEDILLQKPSGYSDDDLNAIFRAVHSLKGGSAYFGLKEITNTSHSTENLMDKARNHKLVFNQALKSIVLKYIDLQRQLLESAKEAFTNGSNLKTTLEAVTFQDTIDDYLKSLVMIEELDATTQELMRHATVAVAKATVEQALQSIPAEENKKVEVAENRSIDLVSASNKPDQESGAQSTSKHDKVEVKEFVKIDTMRLDRLIEYIGEMVISSSMLIRNCRDFLGENETVLNNSNQLERISREIQEIGMSMRLIPIKGLFQKMSRVVWDTAKKTGKEVRFEMHGEDTELDRSVIDRLSDPLMHMVRNAVDHGIEPAAERLAAGKSKSGNVKLTASHGGGNIYIRIEDDGRGLNAEKLIAKAREKGIIGNDQLLSESDAYNLIFAPGFSTASVVTDVSGRGVGMDVVRKNIESMRGKVTIESELGKGSKFIIELPLTMAIMDGIETAVGEEHFIIPSLSVVEFLRPEPSMVFKSLERGETLKFRGEFLPIYRMSNIYGGQAKCQNVCDSILVIIENGGRHIALMVDEVLGKLSVVIKSLGGFFQGLKGLSGCAIMPNGAVGLIIDVASLVDLARNTKFNNDHSVQLDRENSCDRANLIH